MATPRSITIVGGGLAGLTLGLALRQRKVPVSVWEARGYPRHKVCGEFISGRGLDVLARLGWQEPLCRAGACWARTAAFYAGKSVLGQLELPQPALCLSRYVLDEQLARQFRHAGGELHEHEHWKHDEITEGVVRASGRRTESCVDGWRWLGLKVHARGVHLQADLEVHLLDDGYVGLCRLHDAVNVCGLFRSRTAHAQLKQGWAERFRDRPPSALYDRLGEAEFDSTTFCAVAGFRLAPQSLTDSSQCTIGDALTMIPPMTGNGMSMALEAADLAVEPLIRYSHNEASWTSACQEIAACCRKRFTTRLRWADGLHRILFSGTGKRLLLASAPRFPRLLRVLFDRTR